MCFSGQLLYNNAGRWFIGWVCPCLREVNRCIGCRLFLWMLGVDFGVCSEEPGISPGAATLLGPRMEPAGRLRSVLPIVHG